MIEAKPYAHDIAFSNYVYDACVSNKQLGLKLVKCANALHELRRECNKTQTDLLPHYGDRTVGYKVGAASFFGRSKKLLENEDTPAGVALLALKNVLGPAVVAWEPDTIWLELEDREGLDISVVMRDKLMAAITLLEVPAFYWEVNTFMNTVMAFNGYQSNVDRIHEPTPGELAWAVYEAELILHEHGQWEPDFDNEPGIFTAECLHRSGFVLAPTILSFAQDDLDRRNRDGAKITKDQVQSAWGKQSKGSLDNVKFVETPLGIQLAKLAGVELSVSAKLDEYFAAMKELK